MSCSIDTQRDNNAPYDCHQYDEDNSTRVQESEDNSDNNLDYKADCEDLFHEGDDDSDNTLDYKADCEDLHQELRLLHNAYQFLNKEVMQVYTISKLCYWTLFINTRLD